jgi:hypothetical protein
VLKSLLTQIPTIEHIEIWDDRKKHLELFSNHLKDLVKCNSGIRTFQVHHVIQDPCLEKTMPENLEKQLVISLVQRSNAKILAARAKYNNETEEVNQDPDSQKTQAATSTTVLSSFSSADISSNIHTVLSPIKETFSEQSPSSPRPYLLLPIEAPRSPSLVSQCGSDHSGITIDSSNSALHASADAALLLNYAHEQNSSTSGSEALSNAAENTSTALPESNSVIETNSTSGPPKIDVSRMTSDRSLTGKGGPRKSASLFRSIIELAERVSYTGIFLTQESIDLLFSTFPKPTPALSTTTYTTKTLSPISKLITTTTSPNNNNNNNNNNNKYKYTFHSSPTCAWSKRGDHMTCSVGPLHSDLSPYLSLGDTISLRVEAIGYIHDTVLAVKVAPPFSDMRVSMNPIPHITLYVALGRHARESNEISEWVGLPEGERVVVTGTVAEKRVVGVSSSLPYTQRVGSGSGSGGRCDDGSAAKSAAVDLLVDKHFPRAGVEERARVLGAVNGWMEKTFIEDVERNRAWVESFIANLDLNSI